MPRWPVIRSTATKPCCPKTEQQRPTGRHENASLFCVWAERRTQPQSLPPSEGCAEGCREGARRLWVNAPVPMNRRTVAGDFRAVVPPSASLRSPAPPKGEPFFGFHPCPTRATARVAPTVIPKQRRRGDPCGCPFAADSISARVQQKGRVNSATKAPLCKGSCRAKRD